LRFLQSLLQGHDFRLRDEPGLAPGAGGPALVHLYRASDGLWVNREVIARGYGSAATKYSFRDFGRFQADERAARKDRLGVWSPQALTAASEEYSRILHNKGRLQAGASDVAGRRLERARRRAQVRRERERRRLEEDREKERERQSGK